MIQSDLIELPAGLQRLRARRDGRWFAQRGGGRLSAREPIVGYDGRTLREPALQGFACVYGQAVPKPRHNLFVVFEPGCFSATLASRADGDRRRVLLDHDECQRVAGPSDGLELVDTGEGLAFRLLLADLPRGAEIAAMVRNNERRSLSVGVDFGETEEKVVASERVLLVKRAVLQEISLVGDPGVRDANLALVDIADWPGDFAAIAKSAGFASAHAVNRLARNMERTAQKLEQAGQPAARASAAAGRLAEVSQQVTELKARMARVTAAVAEVQPAQRAADFTPRLRGIA